MTGSNIQKFKNQFSGLGLNSLIFLANTKFPVKSEKKKQLLEELFLRYFNEGRKFNLYDILIKDVSIMYFYFAMQYELNRVDVKIPLEHIEGFSTCLLSFLDIVEKNSDKFLLEFKGASLDSLSGLINKIDEAKIKDNNLKQRINIFVENIKRNQLENENDQTAENSIKETSNNNSLVKATTAVALNSIKKLQLKLNGLKKGEYFDVLREYKLYSKEDQEKIFQYGLKKYRFEVIDKYPYESFAFNLKLKLPDVNMWFVLFNHVRSVKRFYIDLLSGLLGFRNDYMRLYNHIREWLYSVENLSSSECRNSLLELFSHAGISNMKHENKDNHMRISEVKEMILNERIEADKPLLNKYKGKKLSIMLRETIEDPKIKFISIKYDNTWRAEDKEIISVNRSILFYFQDFVDTLENAKGRMGDNPYKKAIDEYEKVIGSVVFDLDSINDMPVGIMDEMYKRLNSLLIIKANAGSISTGELDLFYKESTYKKIFNLICINGKVNSNLEYLMFEKHFQDILELFKFNDEDDLKSFFTILFTPHMFYYNRMSKFNDLIIDKLSKEIPHEYYILNSYLNGNETLGLEKEDQADHNNTGEIEVVDQEEYNPHFNISENGVSFYYKLEQYKTKCIIDYFKEIYSK